MSNQAPAGWYPVSAGSTELRWWDGTAWTEQRNTISAEAAAVVTAGALRAPAGTNGNTVWGWLIAASPVVSAIVTIPLFFWVNDIDAVSSNDPNAIVAAIFSPSYFISAGLGIVLYALVVVAGALDHRELLRRGVPRPFHWAWGFLEAPIVYMIGRSVVVKRRTGGGLGPLWLFIGLEVAAFIYSIVLVVIVSIEVSTLFADLALQGANVL